jgi:hypothetical protein
MCGVCGIGGSYVETGGECAVCYPLGGECIRLKKDHRRSINALLLPTWKKTVSNLLSLCNLIALADFGF